MAKGGNPEINEARIIADWKKQVNKARRSYAYSGVHYGEIALNLAQKWQIPCREINRIVGREVTKPGRILRHMIRCKTLPAERSLAILWGSILGRKHLLSVVDEIYGSVRSS